MKRGARLLRICAAAFF